MEFQVLTYEVGFRSGVEGLWQLVFANDPKRNSPAQMISRKEKVQPELFLVGVSQGNVVATVMGGYDGVRGWVYHLATHPEHRGRGYATQLIRELEIRLRQLGCTKLNLQVRAGNDQVVSFYEKLGYTVEPRTSMGKVL